MNITKNKWALITGATSGIGQATAKILANQSYNLILCGRREERLTNLVNELKTKPNSTQEFLTASFDIQKPDEIEKFLNKHQALLKQLDVLLNNAGLAKGAEKVQDAKLQDWDAMLDTNVRGLMHMTRGVLPYLLAKKSGHIVNIGSVAGRWVYPGGAAYCASKFAVRAFTEGLRQDLLGSDIRVTNIEPGMVNTEFSLVRLGAKDKADAVYEGMKALTPEDIAETIYWVLARPQHVNIQELVIYPTDQAHVGQVYRR